MQRSNRQDGFTLLELLIAISIFALVSAISFGTLTQILEQRERINQERNYWRSLSIIMTQLEDDLAFVIDRRIRDIDGTTIAAFIGQPADSRAVSPPSLEFTRAGQWVLANTGAPAVGRIAYRLLDKKILRQQWVDLDRSPTSEPRSTVLLNDVEELSLRFLSPNGKWSPTWPIPRSKYALPTGVEITITTSRNKTYRRLLVTNG
ncbi:MAG: type II secretion system minor pseudopilin GspJ [Acidiferrobacterales bacterium]